MCVSRAARVLLLLNHSIFSLCFSQLLLLAAGIGFTFTNLMEKLEGRLA